MAKKIDGIPAGPCHLGNKLDRMSVCWGIKGNFHYGMGGDISVAMNEHACFAYVNSACSEFIPFLGVVTPGRESRLSGSRYPAVNRNNRGNAGRDPLFIDSRQVINPPIMVSGHPAFLNKIVIQTGGWSNGAQL